MNWKIGDIAVVDCTTSIIHGYEVEILSDLRDLCFRDHGRLAGYEIDPGIPPLHADSKGWAAPHEHLRPLPPPNEVTSWEDCVFQPKELLVVSE